MKDQKIIENINKSLRYHNYENAKFLSSILYNVDRKYKILLPVTLYYDGEYSRSLFFLSTISTYTSEYYEALCHIKVKEFKKASLSLRKILAEDCEFDESIHPLLNYLLVDKNDKEYFLALLGDVYTQMYDREEAIKYYIESYMKNPIFTTIENLLAEDLIPSINGTKENNCIEEYVNDLNHFNKEIDISVISKYKELIPGIGSYAISNIARKYFDIGMTHDSKKCFYLVKSHDPKFLYNMDYFSTVLWHSSDITELGILCKNLVIDAPNSPITWKALGNFYNHKNDYQRSMLCFKRSVYIQNEHYTNTLLGYESIHKNENERALEYFKRSISMLKDNYKSVFGCAMIYDKMEKKDRAEYFFRTAMKMCPLNKHIKVLAMRFFTRKGDMDTAIKIYGEGLGYTTIDINKLIEYVLNHHGRYSELEEFLILEFTEILSKLNLTEYAKKILDIVEYRGDSYYKKKDIIYEKNFNAI